MKQALLTVFVALAGAYFGALCGAYIGTWAADSAGWYYRASFAEPCTIVLGFVGGAIAGVYVVGSIGKDFLGYNRPPQCEQPMPRKGLE